MRRLVPLLAFLGTLGAVALLAICILTNKANNVEKLSGLTGRTVTDGTRTTSPRDAPGSSRLAAAYGPKVVVVTNGVLAPDPRYKFDLGPQGADAVEWDQYLQERAVASQNGLKGMVTFHVVDTTGRSVANAAIVAGFHGEEGQRGMTDGGGLYVVSGKAQHGASLSYHITKHGFYETRAIYQLGKLGVRCLENGRWIPWNPTLRVTLKDIRQPIPMFVVQIDCPMPKRDAPVGFDFEAGDWVAPYGHGGVSDMQLTYVCTNGASSWRRHDLIVTFTNSNDGAYVSSKDTYCLLMSEHAAKVDVDYAKLFRYRYERTDTSIIEDTKLTDREIMVYRVRTRPVLHGAMPETRFGKIYGPFMFAQGREKRVKFQYFLNPNRNDPNLEFDGQNNLFDAQWRGPDAPR